MNEQAGETEGALRFICPFQIGNSGMIPLIIPNYESVGVVKIQLSQVVKFRLLFRAYQTRGTEKKC
jgi:hypothetical protein